MKQPKKRADKLINILYTCPYCSKTTNLLIISCQHMKGKNFLNMKKLFFEAEAQKLEPMTEFYIIKQML